MLPIQTVEGVLNDMSTGSIIDLSEYLKKTEGVSKTELDELKVVISNKLDAEPQHKHHIDDVKQLATELNSKFDKGERYSYNVILNDTEKIPYLEAPKIELLELVKNKEVDGYKFYVDESNGDLMITLDDVLIGSYSRAAGKWSWESNTDYADAGHNHDERYAEVGHTHTTINNGLTINGKLTNCQNGATFKVEGGGTNGTNYIKCFNPDIPHDRAMTLAIGTADAAGQSLTLRYVKRNDTSYGNIGFWGNDDIIKIFPDKTTELKGPTHIDSEYLEVMRALTATPERTTISSKAISITGSTDISNSLTITDNLTCSTLKDVRSINFINSTKDDAANIVLGGTNDNETFLEISTSDNGNEPIYVRQYKRNYVTGVGELQREAALLDADGNTSFPGNLSVGGSITTNGIDLNATITALQETIAAQHTTLSSQETKILSLEADNALLAAKIPQMEAILQNHYQALILLLEQHNMIDTDSTDGANITTDNAAAA